MKIRFQYNLLINFYKKTFIIKRNHIFIINKYFLSNLIFNSIIRIKYYKINFIYKIYQNKYSIIFIYIAIN